MFEGIDDLVRLTKDEVVKIIQRNNIKIIHTCCICGKRLETFWDCDSELDGRWMALDVHFSEVFNCWVADPRKVLCQWCFVNRKDK